MITITPNRTKKKKIFKCDKRDLKWERERSALGKTLRIPSTTWVYCIRALPEHNMVVLFLMGNQNTGEYSRAVGCRTRCIVDGQETYAMFWKEDVDACAVVAWCPFPQPPPKARIK